MTAMVPELRDLDFVSLFKASPVVEESMSPVVIEAEVVERPVLP